MLVRLILGLALTVAVGVIAVRRAWWLFTLIKSGQPDAKRADGLGGRVRAQFVEVFGQRKLLRWSVPGLAHLFTMWGFIILLTVYIEAYGALFVDDFSIPFIGHSPILGFLQDFIAVIVLISIITFAAAISVGWWVALPCLLGVPALVIGLRWYLALLPPLLFGSEDREHQLGCRRGVGILQRDDLHFRS